MPIKRTLTSGKVPVHIWTDEIESSAFDQLKNLAELDIVHDHVAVMPDVHAGIGSTVGTVIPTKKAIIPAAVGVDIGCGMMATQLALKAHDLPISLKGLREAIEQAVPVGFGMHKELSPLQNNLLKYTLEPGLRAILASTPQLVDYKKDFERDWTHQLGTLGGGNHFIELCLDENDNVWIMLHSGSRGVGNVIGRHFTEVARKEMEALDARLPHKDLAYFREGTESFDKYWAAMQWAQDYAEYNRRVMMSLVLGVLRDYFAPTGFDIGPTAVNCHHNYASLERHYGEDIIVTRKGAVRAGHGELGIIPGSMGAKSYIVRGLGNPESFESCSHGAGRRMSRGEAKRRFTTTDVEQATAGVECRKDEGVIDEIPMAYKDIDQVMANQTDLVEVVHTLKQVLCVKG